MIKKYQIWADSNSREDIPDYIEIYYSDLDTACDVAFELAHEHDNKPYRAIFHVEDLEMEETIETYENYPNPCDIIW